MRRVGEWRRRERRMWVSGVAMLRGRVYFTAVSTQAAPRVAGIGEGERMSEFVKVAEAKDVPVGTGVSVEAGGKSIAIFNCEGTFYAIDDTCPHQGGPLGEGEIAGTIVTCPWHEWRFDARTGVNTDDTTCKVATYPVKVEGGAVLVAI